MSKFIESAAEVENCGSVRGVMVVCGCGGWLVEMVVGVVVSWWWCAGGGVMVVV